MYRVVGSAPYQTIQRCTALWYSAEYCVALLYEEVGSMQTAYVKNARRGGVFSHIPATCVP